VCDQSRRAGVGPRIQQFPGRETFGRGMTNTSSDLQCCTPCGGTPTQVVPAIKFCFGAGSLLSQERLMEPCYKPKGVWRFVFYFTGLYILLLYKSERHSGFPLVLLFFFFCALAGLTRNTIRPLRFIYSFDKDFAPTGSTVSSSDAVVWYYVIDRLSTCFFPPR